MGRPSFNEDYESRRLMLRLMSDAELELTALTLGLGRGVVGRRRSFRQRFGITASEAYAERTRRRYSAFTNGPGSQRQRSNLSEEINDDVN